MGVWRNRDYLLALVGVTTSVVGSGATGFGILWWALADTNSGTALAVLTTVNLVGSMVIGPLGGVWLDTADRKKVLVGSDLALALALLAFLPFAVVAPDFNWSVAIGLGMLLTAGNALLRPGIGSLVPKLVSTEELTQANSILYTARNLAGLIAAPLAGILWAWGGIIGVVVANAGTLLVSAACLYSIERPFAQRDSERESAAADDMTRARSFLASFQEGARYLLASRSLKTYLLVAAVTNMAITLYTVSIPIVVLRVLAGGAELSGVLLSLFQAGMFLVGLLLGVAGLARFVPNNSVAIASGLLLMALSYGPLGWVSSPRLAALLVCAAGGALMLTSTLADTRLQLNVPDALLSRSLGLSQGVLNGLRPVGALLAGVLSDTASVGVATGLSGVTLATTALYVLVTRSLDDPKTSVQPRVAPEVSAK
jgi:MFS transporter, DHA3 family, macrolide efflux protein